MVKKYIAHRLFPFLRIQRINKMLLAYGIRS